MLRRRFTFVSIALVLTVLAATDALAVQRTFVASNGSDANPCTLTLPCRGFAVLNLDRRLVAESGHSGYSAIQTRAAADTARVDTTISRSTITLNGANAITIGTIVFGDGFQAAYISENAITNNGGDGVRIAVPQFDNTQGKVVLSGNTIARNSYGVNCNESGLIARTNNTIRDNVSGQIQNCSATESEPGQ